MSIDLDKETLVPLADFNAHWPGKPVSRQALHRYTLKGIRVHGVDEPVVLDSVLLCRVRTTSVEAIRRFIAAQNAGRMAPSPASISPTQRTKQAEAANRKVREKLSLATN